MLTDLEQAIEQIGERHTKLIVLVGNGKTKLLHKLGDKQGIAPLNVNLELARRLSTLSPPERGFAIGPELKAITLNERKNDDLLLLDNLEILFERSLQINPLDLIKRLAHSKRVVAAWPGELRGNRLYYAEITHPEYRDYTADGVVVLTI